VENEKIKEISKRKLKIYRIKSKCRIIRQFIKNFSLQEDKKGV